jgi:hypothetical protein
VKSKKVKKLLRQHCAFWIHWMGLKWWQVEVIFNRGRAPARDGLGDKAGECTADWKYLWARVEFWPDSMTFLSKREIERTVIHELGHILVNEMRAEGIDHEERVVSHLTDAFEWVRDAEKQERKNPVSKKKPGWKRGGGHAAVKPDGPGRSDDSGERDADAVAG